LNLYKYEIEYKNDLLSLQNTGVWTQKNKSYISMTQIINM